VRIFPHCLAKKFPGEALDLMGKIIYRKKRYSNIQKEKLKK